MLGEFSSHAGYSTLHSGRGICRIFRVPVEEIHEAAVGQQQRASFVVQQTLRRYAMAPQDGWRSDTRGRLGGGTLYGSSAWHGRDGVFVRSVQCSGCELDE